MAKIIRRPPRLWVWFAATIAIALAAMSAIALNKPVPEYLVASAQIGVGEELDLNRLDSVSLNLGAISSKYLRPEDFKDGLTLIDTLEPGELVPVSELVATRASNLTAMLITPALEVPSQVVAGGWVRVMRSYELEDQLHTEILVLRAQVVRRVEPEGLLTQTIPQVEVLLDFESAALVMESISAGYDVYLVPIS
jgi:hypothetical protein